MIEEAEIREVLRSKAGRLFHRESQTLEFKEQYNFAGLVDYFRDFAAFANNKGGLLVFGVTDTPRVAVGMSAKSIDSFEKIDPEKITGFLLEMFSSNISWEQASFEVGGKTFGVFKIAEATTKPIIARKDEGKDQTIKNGEIYFRYGGRTQRIQSAELENIISHRIEQTNRDWIEHVRAIGITGPRGAIVLKSEDQITRASGAPLVVERQLAEKLKFIREGEFDQKKGAATLKVVGDVVPIDTIEIEKVVKENLTKSYPLSATELVAEIQKKLPGAKHHEIWSAIAENGMKENGDYSAYNFRNRKQEQKFEETGMLPSGAPSIYNSAAVEFLVKLLSNNAQ